MRILIITEQSDRPESALICGLASRGHTVKVLGKIHPQFKTEATDTGINFQDFQVKNKLDFSASSKLKKIIHEFDPDIVHAFSGRGLAAAIRSKKSSSNFKLVSYRGTVGHLSRLDPAAWISYLNPKIDAISCVSSAVSDYLIKQSVPKNKLFTIYKGHEAAWYIFDKDTSVSKSDLDINNSNFTVACVANSRPVKGLDVLIDAANILSDNINFLIIGELRNHKIITKAKNKGIKFLGYRNDAQAIIGLVDVLVVPSRAREGLPKSLLEAMAQKKTVIASRVGGIPEAVRHEQEALLIPPEDPRILAKAIEHLRINSAKADQMAEHAFNRLSMELTVKNMIQETERMYSILLSSST